MGDASEDDSGLTKSQRHGRRRKARRAARRRIAERADRTGCPQPRKPAYDRWNEVERQVMDRRAVAGGSHYHCVCGWWHNTSKGRDDE